MIIGGTPYGSTPFGGEGATLFSGNLVLQIGPVDATPYLFYGSYKLTEQLNGRDEATFDLIANDGYVPLVGQTILFSLNGGLLFAGTVHERDIVFLSESRSDYAQVTVRAVDWNEIADRHVVVEVFESMTVGAIVRAIVTKYLAGDGITIGDVQEGPLVARMVCAYQTAASCFDDLFSQSGMHWNIDEHKALNMFVRTTSPSPFVVTSANAVFRALKGTKTRNLYRNVQYVQGGKGVTDQRVESFVGDGTLTSFNVQYPVHAAPTITLNFQPQTVGIRGVDTTQQWFWAKGETAIGQGSGTPLQATDTLAVTYKGQYDLMMIVEDSAAILERQTVQGGTGRYEHLDGTTTVDGQDLITEEGLDLLRQYATLDEVVTFETDLPGLAIGQLVTLNVPELGLSDDFLITDLETVTLVGTSQRFTVTATTGDLKLTFSDFFKRFLAFNQPILLNDTTVLNQVLAMHDPVGVTDSVTATLATYAGGEWGTGEAGTAEFEG